MYAIIEDSGRQWKVASGDRVLIDRQVNEDETSITFDRVLLVGGTDGGPRIGAPLVSGATVTADVVGPVKGNKIIARKYKRRKGYERKVGHRQKYTEVRITGINV